jgi:hypothetical protein
LALIFASQPGHAAVLVDPTDSPLPIVFDEWGGVAATKSLITEMAIVRDGNYQFVHTLRDLIYVYAFGERIGSLRIAGISFAGGCGDNTNVSGIENVLAFYEANRIGNRNTPMTVGIGTTDAGRFSGFLTRLQVGISRPEARLAQFAFELSTIPRGSSNTNYSSDVVPDPSLDPANNPNSAGYLGPFAGEGGDSSSEPASGAIKV